MVMALLLVAHSISMPGVVHCARVAAATMAPGRVAGGSDGVSSFPAVEPIDKETTPGHSPGPGHGHQGDGPYNTTGPP